MQYLNMQFNKVCTVWAVLSVPFPKVFYGIKGNNNNVYLYETALKEIISQTD